MNTLKFNEIYSTHYSEVLKYIKSKVYPHLEITEEITNDVFIKVNLKYDLYDSKLSSLRTWIFTIANNTLFDYFRAIELEKKSKINYLDSKHQTDAMYNLGSSETTDGAIIYDETMIRVKKAIAKLDETMQRIAELRYFKQYKYDEIATELNMPMGTVKVNIHRIQNFLVKHT